MTSRIHIAIRGAVQGVGFRPFIYRLAKTLRLTGWVANTSSGVLIDAEGEREMLDAFLLRIDKEKPALSSIQSLEPTWLDAVGYTDFGIRESDRSGDTSAIILPDAATCPECLKEIFDPTNRRYRYPFTNCTHCGPRFSIIESLPYDRPNTSMKKFTMCPQCKKEYEDPDNRRFHAQPNACPECGPQLELWNPGGDVLATRNDALLIAARAIREGSIVAVKGIGGYQLIVDAQNEHAVVELRRRKRRDEKPFALMFSTVEEIMPYCNVSPKEERLLHSPESPIVLLGRRNENPAPAIARSVALHNPNFGVMLPYSPLHHLLMREIGRPVVATSGNLSEEPICIDEHEALSRLRRIADLFLVHNRPIVRHVDDSVARIALGRELVLRRARGYAPLPIVIKENSGEPIVALGAHLKNTIALAKGENVFVSQHIGDLSTDESMNAFRKVNDDFRKLYNASPTVTVTDLHPDYQSTQYAENVAGTKIAVQHHYAHVASCMAENQLEGRVLGVSWDGTGYGDDGTIWGGEFLLTNESSFDRVAHLRRFRLPGGEKAIREPRRAAIGALFEIFDDSVFPQNHVHPINSLPATESLLLQQMLIKKINCPFTSSAGRLFDAVASITGVCHTLKFEGQAAMELEWAIGGTQTDATYEYAIPDGDPPLVIDWGLMLLEILSDAQDRVPTSLISAKFHNTLAQIIVEVAKKIGEHRVVLSGGCFQNEYLLEETVRRLVSEKFSPYWHQRVPPNDGGIALGQIYAAQRLMRH
ncbi:MAG TPA: carbamoyltransferase HypF, partial [Bacteroidota bacterium]|nr:carbamoyltransferase HypF [Bacteroidota bacterium]